MPDKLREMAAKVIDRCRYLAQFTEAPGQIKRTFLSPAMRDCMQAVQVWMTAAGMTVYIDPAGNLRGRYAGASSDCLLIGSHLDTVPDAGAFDGVLGVMIGLALIESLNGQPLPFSIELVGFSEEEGVRYHFPFIGSRALVGLLDAGHLALKDGNGISLAEALESFGLDSRKISSCVPAEGAFGYLEFHIEQGPLLESENLSLGVVHAIAGQSRADIIFTGCANHAGTTPMRLRRDAVAGAAEWITEVERFGAMTPGLVTTVGDLRASPGARNIIAGQLRASLDVRHAEDTVRHQAVESLLARAHEIAQRRGLTVAGNMLMDQPAVAMNPSLCSMAHEAMRSLGIDPLAMVSGAGHDAMILAERIPATMIFIRSPKGISHHPEESVRPHDVEIALAAGLALLRRISESRSIPHA